MIKQDLQSFKAYILGIISLVIVLFLPFAALILKIFKTNPLLGGIALGLIVSIIVLILSILGLIKSLKQSDSISKVAKILNMISIIAGIILFIFIIYIFIKSKSLNII